jgi:hypothetical protein
MQVITIVCVTAEVRVMYFRPGKFMSHDWRIFDVGGARSLVGDGYLIS